MAFLRRGCAFAVLLALGSSSGAIVSNPLPRVCNEFPLSDYVFSGKVLSTTFRQDKYIQGDPSNQYRISVDHVFKGRVPRMALVYTPADSGGGALNVGQRAIVFATRTEDHIVFSGSSNTVSGKGVSRVLSDLQQFLTQPPKVATISGRVDGWVTGPMEPLGGVRVLLASGKSRQFVRVDAHGNFVKAVRPGRWSVRIAEPGWASRTGTYSYDSAEATRLAKGGCADLELETTASKRLEGPDWKRWPTSR